MCILYTVSCIQFKKFSKGGALKGKEKTKDTQVFLSPGNDSRITAMGGEAGFLP